MSAEVESVPFVRPTDDKGRVEIHALTDREIAEETLTYLRLLSDLMSEMAKNPMIGKMFPLPSGFSLPGK
jgi:hypothetical protein